MYHSNTEDISKSQSLRGSQIKSHQSAQNHNKRRQDLRQPVYLSQSDGMPPSPDCSSEGLQSSKRTSTYIYKMKKQALLDSLSAEGSQKKREVKSQSLYTRNSNPSSHFNSQKTTRNHDLQENPYENSMICIEQQIQNIEQDNDALQNQVLTQREKIIELNYIVDERDHQIDQVYNLYFQEQEISNKQKMKIKKLSKEISDLINNLERSQNSNTQLNSEIDSLKEKIDQNVQTLHDEYGRKLGQIQHRNDILKDLQVKKQSEFLQLNQILEQREEQIKDLNDRTKSLEYNSPPNLDPITIYYNDSNQNPKMISPSKSQYQSCDNTPIFKAKANNDISFSSSLNKDDTGDSTQRHQEQKKLMKMISDKNTTISNLSEQITTMQEAQFKLIKNQTDSSAELRKQKELFGQLKDDNNKLCQQIISQQNATKMKLHEDEEQRHYYLQLQEKLRKAQKRIEELEENKDQKEHKPPAYSIDKWSGQKNPSKQIFQKAESTKHNTSQIWKSNSINSTISAMTMDKRKAIDRFNKVTSFGATMGMMSTILDYQSLQYSTQQAENQLIHATVDLSQKLLQKNSSASVLRTDHS